MVVYLGIRSARISEKGTHICATLGVSDEVRDIPLAQIIEPHSVLRLVNRDSIDYIELRDSIEKHGLWNSISVRPSGDRFEIIDGLYRFTACRELGRPTIPCIVKTLTDEEVLAAQIQANAIRPETKPAEFANQIKRMLTLRPEWTVADVAHNIHKSPQWVSNILGLLRLNRDLQKAVDRGEMSLQSAYMLAKIPSSLQPRYAEQAKTMRATDFKALAANVIKSFSEAVRQGRMDHFYARQFEPVPHLRSLKDVLAEVNSRQAGPLVVVSAKCVTPLEGFYTALKWVLHLDSDSIERLKAEAKKKQEFSLAALAKDGDMA